MVNIPEALLLNQERNVQAFTGIELELPTWDQIISLLDILDFADSIPKKGQRWVAEFFRKPSIYGEFTLQFNDQQTKYAQRLLPGLSTALDLLNRSYPNGLHDSVDLTINFIPAPINTSRRLKAETFDRLYWNVIGVSEFRDKSSIGNIKLSQGDVIFCPAGYPPQLVPLTPSAFITFTAIEG